MVNDCTSKATNKVTCIVCPNGCEISIDKNEDDWAISGNLCPRGKKFAIDEMTNPKRSICSTVKTNSINIRRVSVRTDGEVPKGKIIEVMKEVSKVVLEPPVNIGQIVIENVLDTGVNIIATSELK